MSIKITSNSPYEWQEKQPQAFEDADGKIHYTHRRVVLFGSASHTPWFLEKIETPQIVVKIETAPMRGKKLQLVFPHAEEIAYKICKLFLWNTVPKTKVFHQFSLKDEKLRKYAATLNSFECEEYPLTFTIQRFIEGRAFTINPNERVRLNDYSYHRAYLLDSILGKFDARDDNTMLCQKNHRLFETDNEYIGEKGYPHDGVLNMHKKFKSRKIPPKILDDVLSVSLFQIAKIREKYTLKDENLLTLWEKEPLSVPSDVGYKVRDRHWSRIMRNFIFLKMSILTLREQREKITIEKLESSVSKLYLTDTSARMFFSSKMNNNYLHKASLFNVDSHTLEMIIKDSIPLMEQKNSLSNTPLDAAILMKNIKVIELLIKFGAEISDRNVASLKNPIFISIYQAYEALGNSSPGSF